MVGTNNLKSGGIYYSPELFIPHENFNNPSFANDIGLIRVHNIEFNNRVQPIQCSNKYIGGGVKLRLTGWGLTRNGGSASQRLQVLNVNSISQDRCRWFHDELLHDSHLCTLNKYGEGACYVSEFVHRTF